MSLHWHVTIAAQGREARFVAVEAQLATVRDIARVAGPHLVLFCAVDDHVHLILAGSREEVGRIAGSVSQALQKRQGIQLEPARIRVVNGRGHLESLLPYLLSQPRHHHLGAHPATWAGSCLQDLLGARVLGGFDRDRIGRALPRSEIAAMAGLAAGLGEEPLDPTADSLLRDLGAATLWRAAGAAVASVEPRTLQPIELQARIAFVHLISAGKIVPREAWETAVIPEATWYRLAARPASPDVVRAIRCRRARAAGPRHARCSRSVPFPPIS